MRLEAVSVSHSYDGRRLVLDGVDLAVESGETVALMGPSGSGKTTLLSILGLLLEPTSGSIRLDDETIPGSQGGRSEIRTRDMAWVFQTVNVIGHRNALDNAALGLLARGVDRESATSMALSALAEVGMGGFADTRVTELSGGELQRVCIARALAVNPGFMFADEPTGQLDRSTSEQVLGALIGARPEETALIVATHDQAVADRCSRTIRIVDGRLTA